MLVRQLVGNRAGEIIDMPFIVAKGCIEAGTAIRPEDFEKQQQGQAALPLPERKKVEIPADWRDAQHFKKMKWAKEISGDDVKTKAAAEAIIARYVEG